MPTFPKTSQLAHEEALPALGHAGAEVPLNEVIQDLDLNTQHPLRLMAATPPDSKLYLKGSRTPCSDGSERYRTLATEGLPERPDTWLDFQEKSAGEGIAIAWPTESSEGLLRRCIVIERQDGSLEVILSPEVTDEASIPSPLALLPTGCELVGWVDLEAAGSGFKSLGAQGLVIEPEAIVRAEASSYRRVVRQNAAMALVGGGEWGWDGETLAWDAPAQILIPGLALGRNTLAVEGQVLPQEAVAYVRVRRDPGPVATLPVVVSAPESVPSDDDVFIFASRVGPSVLVGGQLILQPQHGGRLDAIAWHDHSNEDGGSRLSGAHDIDITGNAATATQALNASDETPTATAATLEGGDAGEAESFARADHQHGQGPHIHLDEKTGGKLAIAAVSNLQENLDSKFPYAGGSLTGPVNTKQSRSGTIKTTGVLDASQGNCFWSEGVGTRTIAVHNLADGQTLTVFVSGANGAVISFDVYSDAGVTKLSNHYGLGGSGNMISSFSVFNIWRLGAGLDWCVIGPIHGLS